MAKCMFTFHTQCVQLYVVAIYMHNFIMLLLTVKSVIVMETKFYFFLFESEIK